METERNAHAATSHPGTGGVELVLPPLGRPLPPSETGPVAIAAVLLDRMARLWRLPSWVVSLLGLVALVFAVLHFASLERFVTSGASHFGQAGLENTYLLPRLAERPQLRDGRAEDKTGGGPGPVAPVVSASSDAATICAWPARKTLRAAQATASGTGAAGLDHNLFSERWFQ